MSIWHLVEKLHWEKNRQVIRKFPLHWRDSFPLISPCFFPQCTVSATLNSTGDSTGEQRYANGKLATGLLPVDFTMFFFPSVQSFWWSNFCHFQNSGYKRVSSVNKTLLFDKFYGDFAPGELTITDWYAAFKRVRTNTDDAERRWTLWSPKISTCSSKHNKIPQNSFWRS